MSQVWAIAPGMQGGVVGASIMGPTESAALWSGPGSAWTNLGTGFAVVRGATPTHQVGELNGRASLWSGTPESRVQLSHSNESSAAYAIAGDQQVGEVWVNNNPHAALWRGTPESWVDLHPTGAFRSDAFATDGTFQGGFVTFPNSHPQAGTHPMLWNGSPQSLMSLRPAPGFSGQVYGMAQGQQGGYLQIPGIANPHAVVWSGTAGSWKDLHPGGNTGASEVRATNGRIQVGAVSAPSGFSGHAALWLGSSSTFLDLHQFLPPQYLVSGATSVYELNGLIYVGGLAAGEDVQQTHAFLWIGVPAPGSWGVLALAGALASRRSRRAR